MLHASTPYSLRLPAAMLSPDRCLAPLGALQPRTVAQRSEQLAKRSAATSFGLGQSRSFRPGLRSSRGRLWTPARSSTQSGRGLRPRGDREPEGCHQGGFGSFSRPAPPRSPPFDWIVQASQKLMSRDWTKCVPEKCLVHAVRRPQASDLDASLPQKAVCASCGHT